MYKRKSEGGMAEEKEMVVGKIEGSIDGIVDVAALKAAQGTVEEKLALAGISEAVVLQKATVDASIDEAERVIVDDQDPDYVVDMLIKKHSMTKEQAQDYLGQRKAERVKQIEEIRSKFISELIEKEKCTEAEALVRFKQLYADLYLDPVDSFVYKQMTGLHSFFSQVTETMEALGFNRGQKHEELLHIALHSSFKSKVVADEFQKRVRLYLEDAWAGMGAIKTVLEKNNPAETKEGIDEVVNQEEPEGSEVRSE